MADHVEIERTYAVDPDASLPELTQLPEVATVGPALVDDLDAVYFDTADLALTRAGVSLRRRTGGPDEGWHLKVPADAGRDEIRVSLRRARRLPPAELRRNVVAWTLKAPLEPIATIRTRRTRRDLIAGDGTVLAELADDEVTGTPEGSAAPVVWREWELELVEAGAELLDAADELMAGVGVRPSEVQRKIVRVLGDRAPSEVPLPEVGQDLPAGRVLAPAADATGRRAEASRQPDAPPPGQGRAPGPGRLSPAALSAGDVPAAGRPRGDRSRSATRSSGSVVRWPTPATPRSSASGCAR